MYNVSQKNIFKYLKSNIYVASKLEPEEDEYGNQISIYGLPKKYYDFKIQPVTSESESREFGELVSSMKVAVLTDRNKYNNVFKEYDLAYLDGITPKGETVNGEKANYRIYDVRYQNMAIKIYFLKLVK